MPGLNFGVKYRSVKRHGKEQASGRQPLRDITETQYHLGPDGLEERLNGRQDEGNQQEEEDENENEEGKRKKKPRRLEIPGLVHPDDFTPSRPHQRSTINNKKRRRSTEENERQQHTEETGEPKDHYLISLIRKSHRQMYGDLGRHHEHLRGKGAANGTPSRPINTSYPLQEHQQQQQSGSLPHHTQDNYGFNHLLGDENTMPNLASGRLWKMAGQSGGDAGALGRRKVLRGTDVRVDGGAGLDGSLSLSRSSSALKEENVRQWLTQGGDQGGGVEGQQSVECEGRGTNGVTGDETNQSNGSLWMPTEIHNRNNHLPPHQYYDLHQMHAGHRTAGESLPAPSSYAPPVSEWPVRGAPAHDFGVVSGGGGSGGYYLPPANLYHLTTQQNQATNRIQQLSPNQVHYIADPRSTLSAPYQRVSFTRPHPPPPPSPLPPPPFPSSLPPPSSHPYFQSSPFPSRPPPPSSHLYLPQSSQFPPPPSSSHHHLPQKAPLLNPSPSTSFPAAPPHPSLIRPSSLPSSLLYPPLHPHPTLIPRPPPLPHPPPTSTVPRPSTTSPAHRTPVPQSSAPPPPPSPSPPPPPSSSPPEPPPSTETEEFTFSPKPSQPKDVWWGATRSSSIHLVAVRRLESNMVIGLEPEFGWARQRHVSTHLSGLQPSGNDLGFPNPLLASQDLLNLYSNS